MGKCDSYLFAIPLAELTRSCISGGVRGIAELEILRLLHRALGGKIPLQEFFDLIVGTRYAL